MDAERKKFTFHKCGVEPHSISVFVAGTSDAASPEDIDALLGELNSEPECERLGFIAVESLAPRPIVGILFHPSGQSEIADKLLAAIKAGESVSMPSDRDAFGQRLWEFVRLS